MQIRAELTQDISSISHLLKQAFANHPYSNNNEYVLVENLRREHLLTFKWP
ncbi:hypothetical protein [Orbus mooreae]|uniref:hypothetical protein n=1 Tax=Orbus mooreae TaxID=3074107 RepID=UPI00370CFF90